MDDGQEKLQEPNTISVKYWKFLWVSYAQKWIHNVRIVFSLSDSFLRIWALLSVEC